MTKSLIAVAALLLAPLAWGGDEGQVDKRAPADPQGEVEVSNVAGNVSISGWDRNEVQVTGTLGEDVERLDFISEPKRTIIRVKHKETQRRHGDTDAELAIRVPSASRLNVSTVSAEISITHVTGEQRLQSVSGDVSSEIAGEDVEAKTVSGNVVLRGEGKAAVVTVTTVSGDAQVRRAAGELSANSVSGSLNLDLDSITRARVRTTSGDLQLEGPLARDARVDAETISGELVLDFKKPINAEFEIESFTGDIQNCFGPKAQPKSEYGPGSELNFKEGAGSARVIAQSMSGDIQLCGR
ncbi:MAG TPA: DUF4097 family beta strand repeat-containing protein [Steroidobacteraceae bacterium]|nr:DUF4097 family beta strand repeat-containing protein [Steroidobacteraceae bacterium]